MGMMSRRTRLLTVASLLATVAFAGGTTIKKATREISLASQIVRVKQTFDVVNDGSQVLSEFHFCTTDEQRDNLAFQEVFQGEDEEPMQVTQVNLENTPYNVSCFSAALPRSVGAGKTTQLEIQSVFTHLQKAWPAAISQGDAQRMLYFDSAYIISPYPVETQTTKVKLPSKSVESYSKVSPVGLSGTTLTYGPYKDLAPFSMAPMRLHYEQNTPFAEIVSLEREIEVSHWGNVYVEEVYELKHAGAVHKGVWSRLDFQGDARRHGQAAFNEITAILPRDAHSLYYKDEIGNISTSNVRRKLDKVEAMLRPRFPLFGGWSTKFTFGYSLPLPAVASKLASGQFQLSMLFSTPLRNSVVNDLTVKVVLPEGATGISSDVPFHVEKSSGKKYTYLDTGGRPVVYLKAKNVVEEHNQPFTVIYNFSVLDMLKEPFLIVGGILAFFATIILYQHSDFTISHDKTWRARELKLKATDLLQTVSSLLAEHDKALASVDQTAGQGNSGSYKAAEQAVKATHDKLRDVLSQVESLLGSKGSRATAALTKLAAVQATALANSAKKLHLVAEGGSSEALERKLAPQEKALADLRSDLSTAMQSLTF